MHQPLFTMFGGLGTTAANVATPLMSVETTVVMMPTWRHALVVAMVRWVRVWSPVLPPLPTMVMVPGCFPQLRLIHALDLMQLAPACVRRCLGHNTAIIILVMASPYSGPGGATMIAVIVSLHILLIGSNGLLIPRGLRLDRVVSEGRRYGSGEATSTGRRRRGRPSTISRIL